MTGSRNADLPLIVKVLNGDVLIDAAAMSLLFGVGEELVDAHFRLYATDGYTKLPAQWVRDGWRRTQEAAAHNGNGDIVSTLSYWARRDRGAKLRVICEDKKA